MKPSKPKLITCILATGKAMSVIADLKSERGVTRATSHKARGIGRFAATSGKSLSQTSEKEIVNVVAEAGEADALFAWLYERVEIDTPHGGIMFMQKLESALPFLLPDLPEEED
ncbi:MAG: hypothetical protein COW19_07230 [Zetaproteobacteria bacterium CG12_big_fil_rev_8_21_14_0_65_55_1124]|nr:MAG: hypothetical protein COT53_00610 [Zetaproteobacteria bacterium CG08_land_8_20_14_0_20_55_17]PIW42595.1 MAG: hypothetical protein COW19_07230 [Zetaproteobacteria bacterium CG12_big_fil_rev_8_21_14_0_65_55_1124]PIY54200.1 MAG: hypothetical protein COZ01_01060 [Zetaproteobacteria bacterium CG_4_10_14_0_8_um_filter_55_43]PIZ38370.1 MAG: hypothetical protein COY36_06465 [Zetaproteobacteria bacterium CG_4_10_14_0_2_um_filter_55_20]PJB81156.1 MAG: hypothetical protein CO089_05325 [Zetaproteoba